VVGGYLMKKGNLTLLVQPAELLIIGGPAAGSRLLANPPRILTAILKGIASAFTGFRYTKQWHLNSLKLLYRLLRPGSPRRSGVARSRSHAWR
jgi:chemotaxis protein MotA